MTPSMGDTRMKKMWLNLQRTLDNTMSEDGSCGVMTGRQLILQRVSPALSTRVVSGTVSHLTHNRSFGTSVSRQSTALEQTIENE